MSANELQGAPLLAALYLIAKLGLVHALARWLRSRVSVSAGAAWTGGWLLLFIAQSAVVLALSVFDLLYRPYFVACFVLGMLVLAAFVLAASARRAGPLPTSPGWTWPERWPLLVMAVLLLGAALRASQMGDLTWDAQTYGVPRLALWLNAASVFVHMPTPQLNLFVNEWNGELNALAYGLIAGSYLGFGFGNVEVLLALMVSVAWLASSLGAPRPWALALAAILTSAPAILGLAATLKGDLLACLGLIAACAWLVEMRRGPSPLAGFGMVSLFLALAVGAKVAVLLPSLAVWALAIYTLWILRRQETRSEPRKALVVMAVAGLLVLSSRFWVNWAVYGNPVVRLAVEKPGFAFAHLRDNLALVIHRSFAEWSAGFEPGATWALALGMGASMWALAGLALWGRPAFLKTSGDAHGGVAPGASPGRAPVALAMSLLALGTIVAMSLAPAQEWNFRYFLPGLLVLSVGLAARSRPRPAALAPLAAVLVTGLNVWTLHRPGEVMPAPLFQPLGQELAQADTALKRMALFVKGPYLHASVDDLGLDTDVPLRLLVLQDLNTAATPLLGSRAQNRLVMVGDGATLLARAAREEWDAVVISQLPERRAPHVVPQLRALGYRVAVDNASYVIAVPPAALTPLASLPELRWTPWNDVPGAVLEVRNGHPRVESERPVDTGLVTQASGLQGRLLIEACFAGVLAGGGAHAAHLSLHNQRLLLPLPAGVYGAARPFTALARVAASETPAELSFGLGGWSTGQGRLELTSLEVYRLALGARAGSPGAHP